MSTIQDLPSEVLETVFSHLPLATDQQNLCLVCKKWRDIIQQMRRTPPSTSSYYSTFQRRIYFRLPAAGSFNEIHGNEGFAIILYSRQNVIICGLSVFLPHGKGIFYFRFSAYCGEGKNLDVLQFQQIITFCLK